MKHKSALHGMVPFYSNMCSDIRLAAEAGFDALEAHTHKLLPYLHHGGSAKEVKKLCKKHRLKISGIGIIGDVESCKKDVIKNIEHKTDLLSSFAKDVGAPVIQLNAFTELAGDNIKDIIKITAKNIKKIVDIGSSYKIKFQYEGAAWTPIHSLKDCLSLVQEVDRDTFGLVIDFWHFWASRGARPRDIAKLDKNIIYNVHISDGFRPAKKQGHWEDEKVYRCCFPGEGKLPVQEWVDAVMSTGYTGYYSGEFLNEVMWQRDNSELSKNMYKAIKKFL